MSYPEQDPPASEKYSKSEISLDLEKFLYGLGVRARAGYGPRYGPGRAGDKVHGHGPRYTHGPKEPHGPVNGHGHTKNSKSAITSDLEKFWSNPLDQNFFRVRDLFGLRKFFVPTPPPPKKIFFSKSEICLDL